jgi:MFS family permease
MGTMSTWAGSLADRYGPRIPLVTGPLVVALGFVTLALPEITEGPSTYWTTYFLPLLFLGLGMAITSTPLTTAVMGSVSLRRAGVASGVNNAVTRTAGVLAIAMMGAFMLVVFRWDLSYHLELLNVEPHIREYLLQRAGDLGNLRVPDEVAEDLAANIALAIRGAFVEAFQSLCYLSAGLSVVSAIFAYFTIEDEVRELDESEFGF